MLRSAWIIIWAWIGDDKEPPNADEVLAVLNYRRTPEQVRDFVEELYIVLEMAPADKLEIARSRKANPYPAVLGDVEGIEIAERVHCGHNPWLEARRVRNVRIDTAEGERRLLWDEVPPATMPEWQREMRRSRERE